MRKTISREDKEELVGIETPKRPPALDDSAIRQILRGACRELEEEISGELVIDNIRVWVVQSLEVPSKLNWVDPDFLKEKTDLLSLWNIYAQRQVVMFDHESRTVDNWDEQPLW